MERQFRHQELLRYIWEPTVLAIALIILALLITAIGSPVLSFTMTNTLIQMVLVVGLYIFIGNSGIMAFGHITYAMIGAYATAWFTMSPFKKSFALDLPSFLADNSFPLFPSSLVAAILAFIIAFLTGIPIMRMNGIAASIGTFAILVIFNTVYANWSSWTFGASTLVGIPIYVTTWVALAWVVFVLFAATVYQKSRFGLALRASREDEVAARAAGINIRIERLIGFSLSGLFMGVGGVLQAHFLGSIAVSAFWIPSTFILIAMLMIGGQRSLTGAVVGTVVVSVLMQVLRQLEAGMHLSHFNLQLPHGLSELGVAFFMLVILIIRNAGLTGGKEVPWPFGMKPRAPIKRTAPAQVISTTVSQRVGEQLGLEARDISVNFGGLTAISNVKLSLANRELLGLIGPNGAGKTTMINVLTGFQKPTSGSILLDGRDVTALSPRARTKLGLSRTFQAVRLFRDMTVLENLEVAAIGTGLSRRDAQLRAWDVLDWMNIEDKAHARANALPYGDERRVGLARALATAPRYVFLDEPAAGMSDAECDMLMDLISQIPRRFDCGVVLIEHNMRVVMGICERIHVVDGGRTIAEGVASEIQRNPEVIRAYLGTKSEKIYA